MYKEAPGKTALTTQNLLKVKNIDFLGNNQWQGASPEINTFKNLYATLKQRVKISMQKSGRILYDTITTEVPKLEFDTELFLSLLFFYPDSLNAVTRVSGD